MVMKIFPFVKLKRKKIVMEKKVSTRSVYEILEQNKENNIYVLDTDGIEGNKPNLSMYQKLSESHKLWIDGGPRILGDVVDMVMAGAINITIRKNLCHGLDVSSIREITENKIYANIGFWILEKQNKELPLFYDYDGLVFLDEKNQKKRDFKYDSFLKNLCLKHELYAYESDSKNISYWTNIGATGLLVNLNRLEEFKKYE